MSKGKLWSEDNRSGSDLPRDVEKELRYFFIHLLGKRTPPTKGDKLITFAYFANHLCKNHTDHFGERAGGLRNRCHRKIDLWKRKNKRKFDVPASEAPIAAAVHKKLFSTEFDRMSSSSESSSSDSESSSSSSRPTTPPSARKPPARTLVTPKKPPARTLVTPKKKTILPPVKKTMKSWIDEQEEGAAENCGEDLKDYDFANVRAANRVYAVDPESVSVDDPNGITCFIVPSQVNLTSCPIAMPETNF